MRKIRFLSLEPGRSRPCLGRALLIVIASALIPFEWVRADCSLTSTGNIPLNDLGPRHYKGYAGGLYPGGSNTRPAAHEAAGIDIATNRIRPLDSSGNPDASTGKIVMISVGMSNATQEFASKGTQTFEVRADEDPTKNRQLIIVDGAQSGQDAPKWVDPNAIEWKTVNERLAAAGVTPRQVQVAWLKEALIDPGNYGAFPAHARTLQADLEAIIRNLKINYPNIKITYLSTRTRAYTDTFHSPEPFAYETGFAVKWTVEDQIKGAGNLNFDLAKGPVVAPFICWGPYLWADGLNARSDGFIWPCSDLEPDFVHPSEFGGVPKVADQLLAFFKTDPTATPWFLNKNVTGQIPTVTVTATPASGPAPLTVSFKSMASDPDGFIKSTVWTFDDGDYSYAQNPTKTFPAPGNYTVHLTVTDNSGNSLLRSVPVVVSPPPTSDFNGDGKSDILWEDHTTGQHVISLMNGADLSSVVSLQAMPAQWQVASAADFNGDGKPDIIWQNTATGERSIWLMSGTVVGAKVVLPRIPVEGQIAGTGDFNGDGKVDIIWQNTSTGERVVSLTGSRAIALSTMPIQWQIAGAGDFNGDGKVDIIWQNTATGECSVWLMDGTVVRTKVNLATVPVQWEIAGSGDFNHDAKVDILWQNSSTGQRIVSLMDGTSFGSIIVLGTISTQWEIRNH